MHFYIYQRYLNLWSFFSLFSFPDIIQRLNYYKIIDVLMTNSTIRLPDCASPRGSHRVPMPAEFPFRKAPSRVATAAPGRPSSNGSNGMWMFLNRKKDFLFFFPFFFTLVYLETDGSDRIVQSRYTRCSSTDKLTRKVWILNNENTDSFSSFFLSIMISQALL